MQTSQGNILLSLMAAQAFLNENAPSLPEIQATGAKKALDAIIIGVSGHASEQSSGGFASQGLTQVKDSARKILVRDHMAPIARVAKADMPLNTPGITELRVPRGRPTVVQLAYAARGMAKEAANHSAVFTNAGLPTDFVAQLESAVEAMLGAVNDRSQVRGKVTSATKGLQSQLRAGRKVIHVLDAFVRTALNGNAALLAGWNGVKRVQLTGNTKAATPTRTPTPTPTPVPVQVATPVTTSAPAHAPESIVATSTAT